jgi:two-component system, NtrC family, response regulator PilR
MSDKCRVLYVDDHDDSAEMLKLVLADADYEVESARTVDQALEMASTIEFDLYVVDKRLPDGSGLELLKHLEKLTPGIPSIVYTGDVYEIHREQAMAAGAHAFVCKPDIETLIKTVHEFLSERECATATVA